MNISNVKHQFLQVMKVPAKAVAIGGLCGFLGFMAPAGIEAGGMRNAKYSNKGVSDFSKDYLMPILGSVGFLLGAAYGAKWGIEDFRQNYNNENKEKPLNKHPRNQL